VSLLYARIDVKTQKVAIKKNTQLEKSNNRSYFLSYKALQVIMFNL